MRKFGPTQDCNPIKHPSHTLCDSDKQVFYSLYHVMLSFLLLYKKDIFLYSIIGVSTNESVDSKKGIATHLKLALIQFLQNLATKLPLLGFCTSIQDHDPGIFCRYFAIFPHFFETFNSIRESILTD